MLTISEIILDKIKNTPFLEMMISEGLLNLSAFSRKLKPEIEKILMKPVSESAVIMAVKRVADKFKIKQSNYDFPSQNINDITVRSNLSEFTFKNSKTLFEKESLLLSKTLNNGYKFLTFTHGIFETTLILNNEFEKIVYSIFKGETLISSINNLSAIILKLPDKSYNYPGIYFDILKQFAWENISIIEVVSTLNEFSIILSQNDIDRGFSALKAHLWR